MTRMARMTQMRRIDTCEIRWYGWELSGCRVPARSDSRPATTDQLPSRHAISSWCAPPLRPSSDVLSFHRLPQAIRRCDSYPFVGFVSQSIESTSTEWRLSDTSSESENATNCDTSPNFGTRPLSLRNWPPASAGPQFFVRGVA